MRKSTLLTASVATFSALYVAQNLAIENQPVAITLVQPNELETNPSDIAFEDPQTSEVAEPSPAEEPVEAGAVPSVDETQPPAEAPAAVDNTAPTERPAEPTPSESAVAGPAPVEQVAEPIEKTVTSDLVTYEYGVIQIGMTAVDGTLTNVEVLQGDTSFGRDQTYSALISATISAQGTNFGNYSGATFTTEAFRSAVANALGKL